VVVEDRKTLSSQSLVVGKPVNESMGYLVQQRRPGVGGLFGRDHCPKQKSLN